MQRSIASPEHDGSPRLASWRLRHLADQNCSGGIPAKAMTKRAKVNTDDVTVFRISSFRGIPWTTTSFIEGTENGRIRRMAISQKADVALSFFSVRSGH